MYITHPFIDHNLFKMYSPIEPQAEAWPITKLHKAQQDFLDKVIDRSIMTLHAKYPLDTDLYRVLKQTTVKELTRITFEPWACDPKDDKYFWESIDKDTNAQLDPHKLLKRIVTRYVQEISSHFSNYHYRLIVRSAHHTLMGLLQPSCLNFLSKRTTRPSKYRQEKFHILGEVAAIRSLAAIGTVVLVPTHVSNLDSVIIGLAMKQLGIPPLTWGTGLNLFNHSGFNFIFSKLGTYKIDRRKKTIPYLQTQKDYACLTLEWGCHMLFYPGGTRSRSGAIESTLKLGLLHTPFQAQVHNFQKQGRGAKKLFIVPIVLNYHCVWEAPQLIRASTIINKPIDQHKCSLYLTLGKYIQKLEVFINIGAPLDVMGNKVDQSGYSYDEQEQKVDLYETLLHLPEKVIQRADSYIKTLSHKLLATYHQRNLVLSSHLVAFVAYILTENIDKSYTKSEEFIIERKLFMATATEIYRSLCLLYQQKKIDFTPLLQNGPLEAIVADGLAKLGISHPPVKVGKDGHIVVQDRQTLGYYHNRLMSYELGSAFTLG